MRALALALALAAPAAAERAVNPPAVEFPPQTAWLNSEPMTLARLSGRKAVLVAFLNPSSLQSVRELGALKAWFDRYALSQLMVLGVITPELDFQRDPAWIRAAVERLKIEFPVAIDADRRIWRSYEPDGWPALFLLDRQGRIVYDHLGEGDDAEVERELRAALADATEPESLPPAPPAREPKRTGCGRATHEISLGARRNLKPPLALDKDYALQQGQIIVASRDGELATRGRWDVEGDAVRLGAENPRQGYFVRVVYRGAQAFALLAPPEDGAPTKFFVKLEDQWLAPEGAGRNVSFDDSGRSFVKVDRPRLYELTRERTGQPHELYVIPERKGAAVYGFQFSDACSVVDVP